MLVIEFMSAINKIYHSYVCVCTAKSYINVCNLNFTCPEYKVTRGKNRERTAAAPVSSLTILRSLARESYFLS